jgi:kynureninase
MLAELDATDVLAPMRDRFLLPEGIVYMNGNSLGPLCRDVRDRMSDVVVSQWGEDLIRGWNTAGWYPLPERLGDKIGSLIGAEAGETTICDSTSVNLFKAVAAAAALRPDRRKIVTEAGNFPTDLYMLDGLARLSKQQLEIDIRDRESVVDGIDDKTAVVALTHVHYVTSAIFPMREITERAHAAGALVVWDLSHSVGAVEVDLNDAGVDFAVGCGYKHLNGGPGAPAFIYAATRHHESMQQPLSGWFGHGNPFAMSDEFVPADGVRRLLCGTTPILSASALEASVDLMLEVDPQTYFEKSKRLSESFRQLIDDRCRGLGLALASPDDAGSCGAHVSYRHEHAYAIMQNLIARGIIGDFRAPDYMRFGFSPLFMRFSDLGQCVDTLREILESESFRDPEFQTVHAVT